MTDAQLACQHDAFHTHTHVDYVADAGVWYATFTLKCDKCDVPFSFIGPPFGLLRNGPTVNPIRTELRIPIEPGETALPAGGATMRIEVPQKARES